MNLYIPSLNSLDPAVLPREVPANNLSNIIEFLWLYLIIGQLFLRAVTLATSDKVALHGDEADVHIEYLHVYAAY